MNRDHRSEQNILWKGSRVRPACAGKRRLGISALLLFAACFWLLLLFFAPGRIRAYADEAAPLERVSFSYCQIEGSQVVLKGQLSGGITPGNTALGQDPNLYILELEPYDDELEGNRFTTSIPKQLGGFEIKLPLLHRTKDTRLYHKFMACIWDGTKYIAVSEPIYITNPEAAAPYQNAYQEAASKKGLLIEMNEIEDALELGVGQVIVNIPYNGIFGTGIDYAYDGETYHFNKTIVEAYDRTISAFSNRGMLVTAVLLNGWNESTPDLYYPWTQKTQNIFYYHFNTRTEQGFKRAAAVASFLADRYSGIDQRCGRIQNWIIGNEMNNQQWNYIGKMPLLNYVNEYERTFRVFYNAIRSTAANARVFFSTDYHWMSEADGELRYNAKEFIDLFASIVNQRGNIDWNLAYHPYSQPMTEPEFWDDGDSGLVNLTETSPIVNFANLSVLTDYFQKPELRNRAGAVRHIILSEQGFTSQSATRGTVEELQAAAFAYAYYLVDSNPYIDAFILSRQVDAPSEVKASCAFGLWTTDATEDVDIRPVQKKYIWNVFRDIDNPDKTLAVTAFAKSLIGIDKWSDVVPNFKWAGLE